ncbi:lysozyme inhibitor LprI family protein [Pseudomonas sp. TNT2022 ID642]|uniref:lysozyme inhibitor LprI family protein n=1 Tax=Pseudomonas sp. TNT2022 ID642 TaxID=2942632 RepID=UPI002362D06C|nr:lysozyme inhibitor LprI family protein [Pseudomonas sp. TNT2022 ID642]MDD1004927.1 lysozyme inhibitor LprI family protein [Pseudomonas sp. TNT2022 ID642]
MFAISLRHALLLTALAFASVTHASSFDCASAASKTEKAICADPDLSQLDEHLAERWRSTLANVPDPKALKTDQRQWLKSRNACGALTACLRRQYLMRLAELEHATQPFSWDATWQLIPPSTSTAATVTTHRRDSAHITFDIAAGEGANSGNLDGVAVFEGKEAHYAEGECALTFTPINGVLNISQVGADADCGGGMGVYYAGTYVASEQPLTLDYDMLSLGLARTPEENQALHGLLKDDYERLVELSGTLQVGDPSADVPGSQVVEMWMRGLGGTGIIMSTTDQRFWIILLTYDGQGHQRARYYTNAAKWKGRLPDVLQAWYQRTNGNRSIPLDSMP